MKRILVILLIGVILLMAATACGGGAGGGGPSGTYVDESGVISLTFSGNKVTVTMEMGDEVYEEKGTFEAKDGVLIITNEDGYVDETEYTLEGKVLIIDGIEFTKK